MITVSNLSVQFGGSVLFKQVDLQFTAGNCYGIIGANGAGKSTFLKVLSGELDSTTGSVSIQPGVRMSILQQDQFQYDAHTIMDTVIMGNQHLYDVMKEKDALYESPTFLRRTASAPPSWRRISPRWTAGRPNPTPAAFCRAWASRWKITTTSWATPTRE